MSGEPSVVPVGDETEALRAARTALIKFCREFDDYLDTTLVHDALGEIRKVRDRVEGLEKCLPILRELDEIAAKDELNNPPGHRNSVLRVHRNMISEGRAILVELGETLARDKTHQTS